MRRGSRLLALLALLAVLLQGWTAAAEEPESIDYSFAALGDTPYSTDEEEQFIVMLAELNRSDIAFAVHVGDFKSASTACSDELYLQRHDWFRLSRHPFVYVPGDNDWTDCWRPFGAGRDPLERLARLREIFFATDSALGEARLPLARQASVAGAPGARHPEHARWIHGRVAYATLNLPGGDNNRTRMPDEAAQRSLAVREWMKSTFALARELKLPGVVLFMQANPWRHSGSPRPAFAEFLQELAVEVQNYAGNVLLVHGDTHTFRHDAPLLDAATRRPLKNFARLEVYGSPTVNWVRVYVTVRGDKASFRVKPGSGFD